MSRTAQYGKWDLYWLKHSNLIIYTAVELNVNVSLSLNEYVYV